MPSFRWTKQYYGLRKGGTWVLNHEKIASPLDAMRKAWGSDIDRDVITLVGLAPTPVDRGGERFNATYEIVDLGRNRRRAFGLLERLTAEAKTEAAMQKLLSRNLEYETRELFQRAVAGRDAARKQAADRLQQQQSVAGWLRHDIANLVESELLAKTAEDVLDVTARDEKAQATIDAADELSDSSPARTGPGRLGLIGDDRSFLHRRVAEAVEVLEKRLLGADIAHDYDPWVHVYYQQRHHYLASVYQTLKARLKEFDDRMLALAEVARRTALYRKPVDQLP